MIQLFKINLNYNNNEKYRQNGTGREGLQPRVPRRVHTAEVVVRVGGRHKSRHFAVRSLKYC